MLKHIFFNIFFESATFFLRIRLRPHVSGESGIRIRNFLFYFFLLSGDVTRSSPVFKMATSTHALLPIFPEESWVLEWIQISVGYVWTWNFFNRQRKSCGITNIRIRVCGRSLKRSQGISEATIMIVNRVTTSSLEFSVHKVARVNAHPTHRFEFVEWLRSPSDPFVICSCQFEGAQHSIAFRPRILI